MRSVLYLLEILVDVMGVSETWLKDSVPDKAVQIDGYICSISE